MSEQPPWSDPDLHPRDVFDDVPEDGPRQGAHRPREAAAPKTPGSLKAMVIVGSLGLLLGACAYVFSTVNQDRGSSAVQGSEDQVAEDPSGSAGAEDGASASAAPEDAEQVGIFNATDLDGVAGAASEDLTALDWEVIATGNWGMPVDESVVYYASDGVTGDTEEQARLVADALGIEQVQADDAIAYPLVAVIGDDLGEELVGAGQEQSSAQGAAELPQEGAGAQALAADPTEALR